MNRDRLKKALTRHEGLRLKPYRCPAGKLTIGVGRNLDDVGISEVEAMALLENDIDQVIKGLTFSIPWWKTLDDARQEVLMNMAFNMGMPTLLKFKATLSLIQAGKYKDAAAAMLDSAWAKQVGSRATELAAQMETGKCI